MASNEEDAADQVAPKQGPGAAVGAQRSITHPRGGRGGDPNRPAKKRRTPMRSVGETTFRRSRGFDKSRAKMDALEDSIHDLVKSTELCDAVDTRVLSLRGAARGRRSTLAPQADNASQRAAIRARLRTKSYAHWKGPKTGQARQETPIKRPRRPFTSSTKVLRN